MDKVRAHIKLSCVYASGVQRYVIYFVVSARIERFTEQESSIWNILLLRKVNMSSLLLSEGNFKKYYFASHTNALPFQSTA